MAATRVHRIRPAYDSVGRKWIPFQIVAPRNHIEWADLETILRGARTAADYQTLTLAPSDPEAWDIHECGPFGMISAAAANVLASFLKTSFELLEVTVGTAPYYFLRGLDFVECLDRKRSVLHFFKSDPTSIKNVEKYVFRKKLIPRDSLFRIPEAPNEVFATDAAASAIRRSNLRGFQLTDAERL